MDLTRLKNKVSEISQDREYQTEMKKVIVAGVPNIVRLIGEWKSVYRAWLRCSDGVNRPFNVKNDYSFSPLYTMIQKVLEKDKIFSFL